MSRYRSIRGTHSTFALTVDKLCVQSFCQFGCMAGGFDGVVSEILDVFHWCRVILVESCFDTGLAVVVLADTVERWRKTRGQKVDSHCGRRRWLAIYPIRWYSQLGVQFVLSLLKESLTEEHRGWAIGAQKYTHPGFWLVLFLVSATLYHLWQ